MSNKSCFRGVLAAFVAAFMAVPGWAVDVPKSAVVLGSIDSYGDVRLRGVSVKDMGTVFAGDRIDTGNQSYARLVLNNRVKLEFGEGTQALVDQTAPEAGQTVRGLRVKLESGVVAFAASAGPLTLTLGSYEIVPARNSSGNIIFNRPELGTVQVNAGTVEVRHTGTQGSVTLSQKEEGVLNLKTANLTGPIKVAAVAVPAQAAPVAGGSRGGQGGMKPPMRLSTKLILFGAVAVGALIPLTRCNPAKTDCVGDPPPSPGVLIDRTISDVRALAVSLNDAGAVAAVDSLATQITTLEAQLSANPTTEQKAQLTAQINDRLFALNDVVTQLITKAVATNNQAALSALNSIKLRFTTSTQNGGALLDCLS